VSDSKIDETTLTKGQRRKLNALRKSVGEGIGERAFADWLAKQPTAQKPDEDADLKAMLRDRLEVGDAERAYEERPWFRDTRKKRTAGTLSERGLYRIPSTSRLIAFEIAARHGNLSRAARELDTSQSVISRYIATLEKEVGARMFERSRTGVSLTDAGCRFHKAVIVGLGALRAGAAEVMELSNDRKTEVAIACSEEVSLLFLMPRVDKLKQALGERVRLRILAGPRTGECLPTEPGADIVLTWEAESAAPGDRLLVATEALRPYCSPGYAAVHGQTLNGPVSGWGGLTFLDCARTSEGRAHWERWFEAAGHPASCPRYEDLDGYMLALRAAEVGQGIVLGWRHLIEGHVGSRSLVPLAEGFVETGRRFHAVLTGKGRQRPPARACLTFFETEALRRAATDVGLPPATHHPSAPGCPVSLKRWLTVTPFSTVDASGDTSTVP